LVPPGLLNSASSNTDIITSSLYIKEKAIEMDPEYMPSTKFGSANISQLSGYSAYDSYTMNTVPLQAPQKIGVYNSDEYKEWEKKYKKQVYGQGSYGSDQKGSEGFRALYSSSTFIEGFDEYDATPCSSTEAGCINNILDKKLTPIKTMAEIYYKNLNSLQAIDASLNQGIHKYNETWNEKMPTDPSKTDGRSLLDGRNDDMNYLLLQETDTLIVGTIAFASLAMFSIMLLMK